MSGRQKCSLEQDRRKTSPKPPPCCRKPPGRAERKMAGKPRIKLPPECARSIRGHRQFCSRGRQCTVKLEILFRRNRARCLPNQFGDKRNEIRSAKNSARLP